jgi:hypothetical protein
MEISKFEIADCDVCGGLFVRVADELWVKAGTDQPQHMQKLKVRAPELVKQSEYIDNISVHICEDCLIAINDKKYKLTYDKISDKMNKKVREVVEWALKGEI